MFQIHVKFYYTSAVLVAEDTRKGVQDKMLNDIDCSVLKRQNQ